MKVHFLAGRFIRSKITWRERYLPRISLRQSVRLQILDLCFFSFYDLMS